MCYIFFQPCSINIVHFFIILYSVLCVQYLILLFNINIFNEKEKLIERVIWFSEYQYRNPEPRFILFRFHNELCLHMLQLISGYLEIKNQWSRWACGTPDIYNNNNIIHVTYGEKLNNIYKPSWNVRSYKYKLWSIKFSKIEFLCYCFHI